MKHAPRAVSLAIVLACVTGTFFAGVIAKAGCASGNWSDGRQYTYLCYSDIVPLMSTEQLAGGRLPFLQACADVPDQNCDEYPVLTMYLMRAAAWISGTNGYAPFYFVNSLLLFACAAAIAVCLWLLAGSRALWFALAPTLLVYGTVNWDLFAVALATGALVAFADRRDALAGTLLGLGAAAKFYPALLILPLFFQRLQDREPDRAIRVLWSAAATWAIVNVPFAIAAPAQWWEFFRFNAARPQDFDSLWYVACRHVERACFETGTVNLASLGLFVASFGGLWWWKARRSPHFARWTLGFPLLVCFLLTNKVYSPQYGLWLLPWFALAMPSFKRFVVFEISDVAVFVTRFWFFGHLGGRFGVSQGVFEVAILLRALALVWCLAGWLRTDAEPLALGTRGWRRARTPREPQAQQGVIA